MNVIFDYYYYYKDEYPAVYYTMQVPTIDIDMGIIPDEISYDVILKEVIFSYPSRPDVEVSCYSSSSIIEFSTPTGSE